MLNVLVAVLEILAAVVCATAQQDTHLRADAAQALYRRSPFVHGYMHGYEDGFHIGDLEIQTGHKALPAKNFALYRHSGGYDRSYGNKNSFEHGYNEGYQRGHSDALSGRAFQAVNQIRRAAQAMPANVLGPNGFDRALTTGYEAGSAEAQHIVTVSPDRELLTFACRPLHGTDSYCDAYFRGFELGYANRLITPGTPQEETARAHSLETSQNPGTAK